MVAHGSGFNVRSYKQSGPHLHCNARKHEVVRANSSNHACDAFGFAFDVALVSQNFVISIPAHLRLLSLRLVLFRIHRFQLDVRFSFRHV